MRHNDRGMVTAEMAIASLLLTASIGALVGLFGLVLTQLRCVDSAAEIARQAARGDIAAVERVTRDAPAGATVVTTRTTSGMVQVTVTATVRPVRRLPVTSEVVGRALTPLEPGLS